MAVAKLARENPGATLRRRQGLEELYRIGAYRP